MRSGIRLSWGNLDLREVKSPDELPEEFNISAALLDRHIVEGRGAQTALLGPAGRFTYEQLYHFTNQVANAFRALGLDREQRVFLLLRDSPEFVASFLAAQRIGAIPVPVNTAAHPSGYEHYLRLTAPRLLVGDSEFLPVLERMLGESSLRCVLSVRGPGIRGAQSFEEIVSISGVLELISPSTATLFELKYLSGAKSPARGVSYSRKNASTSTPPKSRSAIAPYPPAASHFAL